VDSTRAAAFEHAHTGVVTPPHDPSGGAAGDASAGPLPPLPAGTTVPDDPRALDADRAVWLREQQRAQALQQWQACGSRALGGGAGGPGGQNGMSGPLAVLVLLLVAAAATLAVAFIPDPPRLPAAAPLASIGAGFTTSTGGLLPAVPLSTARGSVAARDARPAVVALVPAACDCAQVLHAAFRQASEFGLRLWLVGEAGQLLEVRRLAPSVGNGSAEVAEDSTGSLHAAYARGGLALVLVHSDGVVRRVVHDPGASLRLEGDLAVLSSPGGSS
jgi:hypothetical protein